VAGLPLLRWRGPEALDALMETQGAVLFNPPTVEDKGLGVVDGEQVGAKHVAMTRWAFSIQASCTAGAASVRRLARFLAAKADPGLDARLGMPPFSIAAELTHRSQIEQGLTEISIIHTGTQKAAP